MDGKKINGDGVEDVIGEQDGDGSKDGDGGNY